MTDMIDYSWILTTHYPGTCWVISGCDYSTLVWRDATPKPSQAELDALWPSTQFDMQVSIIETARRRQYEVQSDGVFFAWQRGDATEAEWRAAVAKVKAANPYPPAQ